MELLDLYRARFGQAVKRQGNGWNGPCPLCGGEPGKSDRFMIWPQRSDNLGQTCAKHGISGIWSCRQCGESGDTIAYLAKVDGLSFKDALASLGIESEKRPFRRRTAPVLTQMPAANSWMPKEHSEPAKAWRERAEKLVQEAEENIKSNQQALDWLARRGIGLEAVRHYRIGYLGEESAKYHGRFRPRKAFGLEPKTGSDGKTHDRLFIPRGIVIPTFNAAGEVLNLRIRRHKADLGERMPKYMEHEGSYKGSLFLPSSQPKPLAVYFITEAELDAMLIHHASGGIVGAVAVRTNRGKPDARCVSALKAAVSVCVALDYDLAGAEGCDFWEQTFSNSTRWPVPEGKDPGDAFALGVDIREWIATALPESVALPVENTVRQPMLTQKTPQIQDDTENGLADTCASGESNLGAGASQNVEIQKSGSWPSEMRARIDARSMAADYLDERQRWHETQPDPLPWASANDFTERELVLLKAALPKGTPLDDIYLDVAVIWLLWRKVPATFIWQRDKAGKVIGFRWEWPHVWQGKNEELFEIFWRYQYCSRALEKWLCDHPADRINARNLLRLWELM